MMNKLANVSGDLVKHSKMDVSGRRKNFTRSVLGASEEDNEVYCDPCEHDGHHLPAEGYCVDCQEYLCSACYKVHCRPAVLRHHHLQDKQSMPKVKLASTVKYVCTEICQKHRKVIEYFCNLHESFGCSACMRTQHRACEKVDFIPECAAIFGSSKELKELQRKRAELLTMNGTYKSEISRKSQAVVLQAERAKLHVNNLRKKITDMFDRLEKKIDESIDDLKGGDEQKMTELANETHIISQNLQKYINDVKSYLNEKKMCQLFMEAKRINEPLKDLTGKVASIGESCKIQRYQFTPDQIIVDMMEKVKEIGVLDIMDQHAKVPKFERDINVREETDECECEISGIAVMSEQLLVVADSKNRAVKLIDMTNNYVKCVYKLDDWYPHDVTKVGATQIAVTYPDKWKIKFLDIKESGSMKMQRVINANGQCCGIECMGDNLIVSFKHPPAVKILTMTGAVIRTIGLDGNVEFTDFLAVNPLKNLVYVSNLVGEGPDSVICVTNDGARKAVFEDERLDGPYGATVDSPGVVYVCGVFSENVVQLSEDCSMIQELLNTDDGLQWPWCLALSRQNDKLYIGMDSDNIKMFQLY